MLLHVELGGALGLPVDVLGHGGVEALRVVADVGDDEGVAAAVLENADVLPLLHSGLWKGDAADSETHRGPLRGRARTPSWERLLPKCIHVTRGAGEPLTLQSKRALRPSMTSRTSSLRVNSGSLDGVTLSVALEVSSSVDGVASALEREAALLRRLGRAPLAVLSLHVYVPLSSSCTEFSSRRHLRSKQSRSRHRVPTEPGPRPLRRPAVTSCRRSASCS